MQLFLKYPPLSHFPISKPKFTKFDLAVKYVNINTELSFEQNIISLKYDASYQVSSKSAGSWKEDFSSIYTYMDMSAILVL